MLFKTKLLNNQLAVYMSAGSVKSVLYLGEILVPTPTTHFPVSVTQAPIRAWLPAIPRFSERVRIEIPSPPVTTV